MTNFGVGTICISLPRSKFWVTSPPVSRMIYAMIGPKIVTK